MTANVPPRSADTGTGRDPQSESLPGTVAYQPSGYPAIAGPPIATGATTNPVSRPIAAPALPAGPPHPSSPHAEPSLSAVVLRGEAARRRRPNRRLIVAAVTAVALFTAIGIATTAAAHTDPPQTVVQSFFAALANRDGQRLRTFGVCDESPLCSSSALATGYQPPQHLRIVVVSTSRTHDQTVITVQYDIDGANHQDTIGLTRIRQNWLSHVWRITQPPGARLRLDSSYFRQARLAGIELAISGNTQPAPDVGGNLRDPSRHGLWAPPGRYSITATGDQLIEPAHLDITIAEQHTPEAVTITPRLNPGVQQQITQQIHARIDQCASQADLHPAVGSDPTAEPSCPFRYDSPYTLTDNPHWTVSQYPTIALTVEHDGSVTVTTTKSGRIKLSYRWTLDVVEPRRWTTDTNTQPITVGGHATLDHDTITWAP